ncbi:MAG: Flp pilus assembly complex ATPase component TadA [Phycisphaerae bacterium]|nr:Flp pilus assembly complex ATPase component TadA [Phycisphaerae bacterium]
MAGLFLCPAGDGEGGSELGATPVTIGRHPDNTISIKDDLASRFHCVIEPDGRGGFRVRDLGSRNGTKLNNGRISEAPLKPGDVLRIGSIEWEIRGFADEHDLGEPQFDRVADDEAGAPAHRVGPASSWFAELTRVIEALPPKGVVEDAMMIDGRGKPSDALQGDAEGPRLVRTLLATASKARATDLHVEPKGERVNVRMRVDGQMIALVEIPFRACELAFGLIKTASQIRQASRDAVQEGHFGARLGDRRVDYRVSFTPSMHGQKLVLRVLDSRHSPRSFSELGMPGYMEQRIRKACQQDSGMLLVCGPTGSGKTTTLYNAIRDIDRNARNVVTIEDPVEYQIEGVTQIPIDENQGNTFGSLLRSVLRQDPDVILVGEIRDEETARTAMQAAMTGHLVFSTVHAKDSISAVFRILDLKVEPFLVGNSLQLVLAQRLLRVLCDNCKRPVRVTPGQASRIGRFLEGRSEVFAATGCAACLRTGFRGRRSIYELLDFNDDLRDVILREPTIAAMKKIIEQGLFTTLVQSGWQLVARGITSLEEVEQVAGAG